MSDLATQEFVPDAKCTVRWGRPDGGQGSVVLDVSLKVVVLSVRHFKADPEGDIAAVAKLATWLKQWNHLPDGPDFDFLASQIIKCVAFPDESEVRLA